MTRSEKITLLQNYEAGKSVVFPKADDVTCWQFDGALYIRVEPKTDLPHPSKMQLDQAGFNSFTQSAPHRFHIIWDSAFTPYDIDVKGKIVRVGVEQKNIA